MLVIGSGTSTGPGAELYKPATNTCAHDGVAGASAQRDFSDGDATSYAAAYRVFIAAAVAPLFGDQVQEKLTLGGHGGGAFELDGRDGVALTVTRVTTCGAARSPGTDHQPIP